MKSATTDEGKGKCIFLLSEAGIDSGGRDTNNGRGRERERGWLRNCAGGKERGGGMSPLTCINVPDQF